MEKRFRSGFVAIIGRPNVGKSTLVNSFVKQKIAIISEKPQTTRHKIRCVVTQKDSQVIFIDTPGFHKPKDPLGEHLNRTVRSALKEVEAILFLVDASVTIGTGDSYIAKELAKLKTPIILVLNKKDKIPQAYLEAQLEVGKHLGDFKKILSISALTGEGVKGILGEVIKLLPEGEKYYSPEVLTDQPEKVVITEFIREKVLAVTREEVPYSVAVEAEEIVPREGNKELIDVFATIFVERESQKGIIIGREGRVLKEIGTKARRDIQNLLGSQVYLDLRVKVKKDWRKDENSIKRFGYY